MPRYRKRPVVIEAVQYLGNNGSEVDRWMQERGHEPAAIEQWRGPLFVNTNHGVAIAKPTDWIIYTEAGELYPCSEAEFRKNYELAEVTT